MQDGYRGGVQATASRYDTHRGEPAMPPWAASLLQVVAQTSRDPSRCSRPWLSGQGRGAWVQMRAVISHAGAPPPVRAGHGEAPSSLHHFDPINASTALVPGSGGRLLVQMT